MDYFHYFQSFHHYFWQWEEEGRIIATPNGRTIAYTPFVAQTLELLTKQGWPRFGTLLLALLATSRDAESDIVDLTSGLKTGFPDLSTYHLDAIQKAEHFLLELTLLPQQYKEGAKRSLLLQTLFKSLSSPVHSFRFPGILETISGGALMAHYLPKTNITPQVIYSDFHPFIKLSNTFPDADAILEAMGEVPEVEEERPEDEGISEPAGDFLQELLQNPITEEIGALLPQIWGALEIPHHNRLPGRQALGGVAGLSNKGEAHRLLVSEFANDDLIFLSRLANNEALYLDRETPPPSDNRERVLLLDTSLKSWGTPHTVGFALLLAITRHPKSGIPCSVFAVHDDWKPLHFNDIHQIIEGLMVLEPSLHPAEGMERFFRENPEKRKAEVFLLSTADTLRLPAMQQAMAKFQPALSYWLLSDHLGKVDIYKKWGQGKRHVKTFQLPTDQLWKKKTNERQKKQDKPNPKLARAFYPILFPGPKRARSLLRAGDDIYVITLNFALMRKAGESSKCWEMLYENLPHSPTFYEIGVMKSGHPVLLAFSFQSPKGFLLNIATGELKELLFPAAKHGLFREFVFNDDWFYFNAEGITYWWSFHDDPPPELCDNPTQYYAQVENWIAEKQTNPGFLNKHLHFPGIILKDIKRIGINDEGNLVFDYHQLQRNGNGFSLSPLPEYPEELRCEASLTGEHEFTFPGGNQVIAHTDGMLILKHQRNIDLPIFLPAVVQKPLCLYSDNFFCGDEMYVPPGSPAYQLGASRFNANFLNPFIQTCMR